MSLGTVMVTIIATSFGIFAGGQLLVAATAKLSGFVSFTQEIGDRRLAWGLVLLEIALGLWAAIGIDAGSPLFVLLAGFYGAGAVHRARVVRSPTKTSCLCAHAGKRTTWADVVANVLVAGTALAVAAIGPDRPLWTQLLGCAVAIVYLAGWLWAELTVRRPRRRMAIITYGNPAAET